MSTDLPIDDGVKTEKEKEIRVTMIGIPSSNGPLTMADNE